MRYVEHNGMGYPNDPSNLLSPWLYDGVNFIVFEDFDEKEEYCKKNYPNWYSDENIIQGDAN